MKIHSCIEAHIEDYSNISVEIQQPYCCCNSISIVEEESGCDIDISENMTTSYNIHDGLEAATLNIESRNDAIVTLEWVCGVGFSERYLCGCDSELITIDGNYLVVKYKPKS